MNDEKIEEIKNSLREVVQLLAQRGKPLSKELKAMLVKVMDHAATRITQLRQEDAQRTSQTPIPDTANLLWILAGGQPEAFVSYLREFPDPQLNAILQNPTHLVQIIEQLQRNNPIKHLGQEDGIQQANLQSSNVYGFRFNPQTKKMQVRFQEGAVYEYDDIPDVIFNLFSHGNASAKTTGSNRFGAWFRGKNPSLGAALNQYIKQGGYAYRKLK